MELYLTGSGGTFSWLFARNRKEVLEVAVKERYILSVSSAQELAVGVIEVKYECLTARHIHHAVAIHPTAMALWRVHGFVNCVRIAILVLGIVHTESLLALSHHKPCVVRECHIFCIINLEHLHRNYRRIRVVL